MNKQELIKAAFSLDTHVFAPQGRPAGQPRQRPAGGSASFKKQAGVLGQVDDVVNAGAKGLNSMKGMFGKAYGRAPKGAPKGAPKAAPVAAQYAGMAASVAPQAVKAPGFLSKTLSPVGQGAAMATGAGLVGVTGKEIYDRTIDDGHGGFAKFDAPATPADPAVQKAIDYLARSYPLEAGVNVPDAALQSYKNKLQSQYELNPDTLRAEVMRGIRTDDAYNRVIGPGDDQIPHEFFGQQLLDGYGFGHLAPQQAQPGAQPGAQQPQATQQPQAQPGAQQAQPQAAIPKFKYSKFITAEDLQRLLGSDYETIKNMAAAGYRLTPTGTPELFQKYTAAMQKWDAMYEQMLQHQQRPQ